MLGRLVLLLAAFLVACGDSDGGTATGGSGPGGAGGAGQGGGGGSPGTPVAGESSVTPSCAPDDGPAFTIEIGLAAAACDAMWAGPALRMTFFTEVETPAGNTWSVGQGSGEAFAIYHPDGDPSAFVSAESGTLSIDTWTAAGATGTYDVLFADGAHLAGSFDAFACPNDGTPCG